LQIKEADTKPLKPDIERIKADYDCKIKENRRYGK